MKGKRMERNRRVAGEEKEEQTRSKGKQVELGRPLYTQLNNIGGAMVEQRMEMHTI